MGRIRLTGATSGYTELRAANAAGNNTITLPTTSGGEVIVSDSSGNVNIDGGTLYVDATNNRVGIGTSTVASTLHIVDSSSAANGTIRLGGGSGFSGYYSTIQQDAVSNGKLVYNIVAAAGAVHGHQFQVDGTAAVTIDASRRVGIGSSTPSSVWTQTNQSTATISAGIALFDSAGTNKGQIGLAGAGTGGDSSRLWLNGKTDVLLNIDGTEAARIDSSRRLLVGTTTSNGAQLEVNRPQSTTTGLSAVLSSPQFSITNSSNWGFPVGAVFKTPLANGGAIVDNAAIWAEFESTNNAYLGFATRSSGTVAERMRITNTGLGWYLAEQGCFIFQSKAAAGTSDSALNVRHSATAITGTGSDSFRVYTNGNVVNTNNSYGSISDLKLKENIIDASSQWADLKALQVRNYNFKEETGQQTHTQIGLIAQEVEQVSPGLVTESPDRDAEGNDLGTVTKSVNYSVLYMKAVKALQEAMERIEVLEQRLTNAGIS